MQVSFHQGWQQTSALARNVATFPYRHNYIDHGACLTNAIYSAMAYI